MAGSKEGGLKAKATNLARESGFYSRIGAIGGKNGHTGGFYANRDLARRAGAIGGRRSKRRPMNPQQSVQRQLRRAILAKEEEQSHGKTTI